MSLFDRIVRAFIGDPGEPAMLDNVQANENVIDWREAAVKKAAARHGKPFLCAADGVLRERFVGSAMQKEIVRPQATVTPIRRKTKEK